MEQIDVVGDSVKDCYKEDVDSVHRRYEYQMAGIRCKM